MQFLYDVFVSLRLIMATFTLLIFIPGCAVLSVDNEGGMGSSIALDSFDRAHISHVYCAEETHCVLKYSQQISEIEFRNRVIYSEGVVPEETAIAIDHHDNVHIVFTHDTSLKYITNSSGSWMSETIDGGDGEYYYYASLALDSLDHAHVSYIMIPKGIHDDYVLKYSNNSTGSWIAEIAEGSGVLGMNTSIITALNGVLISYSYRPASGRGCWLKTAYKTLGRSYWQYEVVDNSGCVGSASMALDAIFRVHISYYDLTNKHLNYATEAMGSWITETVDRYVDTGAQNAITVDNTGKAHISYYWRHTPPRNETYLMYAQGALGAWETSTLDSGRGLVSLGWTNISIASDSEGYVHVSYDDMTNGHLKYANTVADTVP